MGRATKTQHLAVYQNSIRVGTLERAASGAILFTYAPEWLETKNSFPVSLSMPLREEAYKGGEIASFIDNLLPDNIDIRQKVARRVKAESAKAYDLLAALGQDCVGALQFIDPDVPSPGAEKIRAKPLSEEAIAKTLKSLGLSPLGMQEDAPEFRISIAGAQEKTALLWWRGKWHLPLGTTPTSHMLKPPMGLLHNGIDLSTSVENEWLCLQVCAILGLKVPRTEMRKFGDQRCLVVERFDRRWVSREKIIRLPQEDMCQALGYPPTQKYESDGGPGIEKVMNLLDASDERNEDRAAFMRSQLIFYLLGATDGHAKNYSIFLTPAGFAATPVYDVMSIFPAIEKRQVAFQKAKLAMAVGESRYYRLRQIARRHFEQTAKQVGFPLRVLNTIIEELVETVPAVEDKISLPKGFPEGIFRAITEGMKRQAKRLAT